jgi:hypothetical protein
MENCFICGQRANIKTEYNFFEVNCSYCGIHGVTRAAAKLLNFDPKVIKEKIKISATLSEINLLNPEDIVMICHDVRSGIDGFYNETVQNLIKMYPENINDRIDRSLINLSRLCSFTGEKIEFKPKYELLFYPDSTNDQAFNFMYNIAIDQGYITSEESLHGINAIKITAKGWNRIFELKKEINNDSKQGFIAMWFNHEVDKAHESIARAVEKSGYLPKRIDNHESNKKICDEIISEIRKSKFIVCDFTGQRGGVYFEAGFAYGLGLPTGHLDL